MVFTVNPNIARQRTYRKDLLANALAAQPGLGSNPYTPPNWNFLRPLVEGAMAGRAGAEAQRLENQQKAAQAAIAQALMGKGVPAATAPAAPQPTDFLSRATRAIFPSTPTVAEAGRKYAGATTVTPEMMADAGADPLLFEIAKQKISTTKLTTDRANNLREATGLYYKIKTAGEKADPAMVQRFRELSTNLPTELKTADYKVITTPGGKAAYVPIDILGNTTGKPTFEPSPLVDMGSRETAKLQAQQEIQGTVAEQAADRTFGKYYADTFIAGGGFEDLDSSKTKIQGVIKDLKEGKLNLTGLDVGLANSTGRLALTTLYPDAANALDTVEEVVQRNLRVILGAQFTEREGTRLIERAYNPFLSEKVNANRLERLVSTMERQLQQKIKAIEYYQNNNRTLRGFKGYVPSLNDVQKAADSLIIEVATPKQISNWNASYLDTLTTADNKPTNELLQILDDPAAKTALIARARSLGLKGFAQKNTGASGSSVSGASGSSVYVPLPAFNTGG
tara:strand:+ start:395 stop:1921 length:1527 start_codon:yes stop_codon:yes gene_type:complete